MCYNFDVESTGPIITKYFAQHIVYFYVKLSLTEHYWSSFLFNVMIGVLNNFEPHPILLHLCLILHVYHCNHAFEISYGYICAHTLHVVTCIVTIEAGHYLGYCGYGSGCGYDVAACTGLWGCGQQVEVEEEELQPKEVEKEVVTEVKVPQVKAMFAYTGEKGMKFEKGEVRVGMRGWVG